MKLESSLELIFTTNVNLQELNFIVRVNSELNFQIKSFQSFSREGSGY